MATLRLYKFLSKKFALAAIRDQRIKISKIQELNDPFEYLGLALRDPTDRLVLRKTKADLSRDHGLVCLSANWSHPLMWSHYADHHRGVCLGFDAEDSFFHPVQYVSKRLTLDALNLSRLDEIREEHIIKLLFCKFSAWRYEKEYRAHTTIDESDEHGLAFMNFSEQFALREIVVGAETELSREEIQHAAGRQYSSLIVRRARLAFNSFRVVEQRNKNLW